MVHACFIQHRYNMTAFLPARFPPTSLPARPPACLPACPPTAAPTGLPVHLLAGKPGHLPSSSPSSTRAPELVQEVEGGSHLPHVLHLRQLSRHLRLAAGGEERAGETTDSRVRRHCTDLDAQQLKGCRRWWQEAKLAVAIWWPQCQSCQCCKTKLRFYCMLPPHASIEACASL